MSDVGRISPEAWSLIALVAVVALAGTVYLTLPDATTDETPVSDASTEGPDELPEAAGIPSESVARRESAEPQPTLPPASPVTPTDTGPVSEPVISPSVTKTPSDSDELRSDPAAARNEPSRRSVSKDPERTASSATLESSAPDSTNAPGSQSITSVAGLPNGSASGGKTANVEAPITEPTSAAPARESAAGGASPSSGPSNRGSKRDASEPTSIPVITMQPSASRVSVGDVVSVVIVIDGATNVGHTPFHVRFNPAILRFVSGAEGSFLGSDGQPTAFFATATSEGASVVVGLSRLGPVGGVSGSGDLCVLAFEVVGSGNSGLAFSRAKVRDSSNAIVPAVFQRTTVIGS